MDEKYLLARCELTMMFGVCLNTLIIHNATILFLLMDLHQENQFEPACEHQPMSPFICLINRTFSINQQCFSIT
jgi:hypothetical protein